VTARAAPKSEVNITPFVDVMLVLLIIFMVAAPLATTSIKATMPPPSPPVAQQISPVFVSLQKDGTIHVGSQSHGERAGDWRSLAALLREMSGGNFGAQVFVRADREVSYGDFVRLFDEVRAAGYAKVSVMTEDPGA
jgi:biopolymer transport protein ExbD